MKEMMQRFIKRIKQPKVQVNWTLQILIGAIAIQVAENNGITPMNAVIFGIAVTYIVDFVVQKIYGKDRYREDE